MANKLMGNAHRDRTDSIYSQDATQSRVLDSMETGRQRHRANWKSVMETPPGDIKNKKATKLGPQHYPTHQWKFAGKEKKGEKKKDTLEKETQAN